MAALKVLVAIMAMVAAAELAAGKTYTVNWSASGSYGDWSSKNPVAVGDSVEFNYGAPHTVDELSEADYKACSFAGPVSSDASGNTTVVFDAVGTRYFACAAGSHCAQGQKVAITVAAGSTAAAPPPESGGSAPPKGDSPPAPATPKGDSPPPPAAAGKSAAPPVAVGRAGLAVKLVLSLAVGAGAVLAAV